MASLWPVMFSKIMWAYNINKYNCWVIKINLFLIFMVLMNNICAIFIKSLHELNSCCSGLLYQLNCCACLLTDKYLSSLNLCPWQLFVGGQSNNVCLCPLIGGKCLQTQHGARSYILNYNYQAENMVSGSGARIGLVLSLCATVSLVNYRSQ